MKKRGFTLIELLAVIVVLAIIALIATPIVMNIIKKANMGAAERSADNYVKAVETLIATKKLDGTPLVDGKYEIIGEGKLKLGDASYTVEVSGTKPVGGSVVIENGQVVKNSSTIDYTDHTVKFENGKASANEKGASISELAELCDLQEGNEKEIGAKYVCDLGDGDRTFYVLEVGSNPVSNSTLASNEVALILEENYDTTYIKWCLSGNYVSCNADGLETKLDEISGMWTELNRQQLKIPSIEQIVVADGRSEDEYLGDSYADYPTLTKEWLYGTYGYWTSTPVTETQSSIGVWAIQYNGKVTSYGAGYPKAYGVRPVITLSAN